MEMPSDQAHRFDVFLSHNSADKPAVEAVAERLTTEGIAAFLDKWHLIPGDPWQEALEEALQASAACADFDVGGTLGGRTLEGCHRRRSQRIWAAICST